MQFTSERDKIKFTLNNEIVEEKFKTRIEKEFSHYISRTHLLWCHKKKFLNCFVKTARSKKRLKEFLFLFFVYLLQFEERTCKFWRVSFRSFSCQRKRSGNLSHTQLSLSLKCGVQNNGKTLKHSNSYKFIIRWRTKKNIF